MSKKSKDELVKRTNARYLQASRAEKTRILDEFVAVTGFHRKHAIRKLRKGSQVSCGIDDVNNSDDVN